MFLLATALPPVTVNLWQVLFLQLVQLVDEEHSLNILNNVQLFKIVLACLNAMSKILVWFKYIPGKIQMLLIKWYWETKS